MDIGAVNALSREDFVYNLGNLVDKCPVIASEVWSQRPFVNLSALEAAVHKVIEALPETGKEEILRCLPDLAGRDLQNGTLTRASHGEMVQAGLDTLDAGEVSRMAHLNMEYRERFGFPFVICARMNDKAAILQQLLERLGNERGKERALAIEELKKIGHLRLLDLVLPDTVNKL